MPSELLEKGLSTLCNQGVLVFPTTKRKELQITTIVAEKQIPSNQIS